MNILMIGGTRFIGPAIVEHARDAGHTLTLLHRGVSAPDIFPDLEHLHADRFDAQALTALATRSFDAVIDTSAYVPRAVSLALDALQGRVGHYVYISTLSVYDDVSQPGLDESGATGVLEDPDTEELTPETYGPLKAACERVLEARIPGAYASVRAGLVVGPTDPTDRFTYWPARLESPGPALAPGSPQDPFQVIDVRDLAKFCVHLAETATSGTFNATGPSLGLGALLDACPGDAEVTWVTPEFLEEHEVRAWVDLPCWVPPTGETAGFGLISTERARHVGLTTRPIAHTIRDTLSWWHTLPQDRRTPRRAGLSPEREAELIAAWHAAHP